MLIQFALVVFAICGMLSLVIDIGMARLSQGRMQAAADAASIEGLRQRDVGVVVNAATGARVQDAFGSDCLRRASANRLVRWTFDDDFATDDDAYQFGAGPIIDLTDGATALHGLQTISVPATRSYKPSPQMNQANAVEGDMVSGRFCYEADPHASEGVEHAGLELVCTQPQRADGSYARNDFNPNAAPPGAPLGLPDCPGPDDPAPAPWPVPGTGTLANADNTAFLVRLRRGTEYDAFTDRVDPGVASSGPSLPLTFGKATTIAADDPAGGYSIRRDGLTVRATAIASTRPAAQVGLPRPASGQLGVTPFALADTYVAGLTGAATAITLSPATGLICSGVACAGAVPANAVGRFVDALTDPARTRWRLVSRIGLPLPAAVPVACGLAVTLTGYGPVYATLAGGAVRIIGFTRITLAPDPTRPLNPCARTLTRGASLVAPSNASAIVTGGLDLPAATPPATVRELLDRHFVRAGRPNYAPVLTAALAR